MEYFIIKARESYGLTKAVNEYIKDGWKLYGSPYTDGKTYHFQAVIRKAE